MLLGTLVDFYGCAKKKIVNRVLPCVVFEIIIYEYVMFYIISFLCMVFCGFGKLKT
jgi:hypothetical protein